MSRQSSVQPEILIGSSALAFGSFDIRTAGAERHGEGPGEVEPYFVISAAIRGVETIGPYLPGRVGTVASAVVEFAKKGMDWAFSHRPLC